MVTIDMTLQSPAFINKEPNRENSIVEAAVSYPGYGDVAIWFFQLTPNDHMQARLNNFLTINEAIFDTFKNVKPKITARKVYMDINTARRSVKRREREKKNSSVGVVWPPLILIV